MSGGATVQDILDFKQHKEALCVSPQHLIIQVADLLTKHNVGLLVVIEDGDNVVGVVSERDIVQRAVAGRLDASREYVTKIMTTDVTCIRPTHLLMDCIKKFRELNCRHLPVITNEDKLMGVISEKDISGYFRSRLDNIKFE